MIMMLLILFLVCPLNAMQKDEQKWDGKHYQKNSSPQYQHAVKLLNELDLSQSKRIIDIGCGTGDVTATMALMAPQAQVVGVDANDTMIATAQKNYKEIRSLYFEKHDVQTRFTYVSKFDLAFSSAVFIWIKEKQAAFNNIHAILADHGKVVISTSQPLQPDNPINKTLMKLAQNPRWTSLMQEFKTTPQFYPTSYEQAKELLKDKWENVELKERPILNTYKTKEEFAQWILGWVGALPAMSRLGKSEQVEFANEFARVYLEDPETKDEQGTILYKLKGLLIQAQKK